METKVKPERQVGEKPRTFETFPEDSICPVCKTSDDGECVLVSIDGTSDGSICEAQPFHLGCAIATNYNKKAATIYRLIS